MVVGQYQPQMCFQPRSVFTKSVRLTRQAPRVLAQRQVLAFNKAGIDGRTHTRSCHTLLDDLWIAKHNFVAHRHDLPTLTLFDHLSVEQIWTRHAPWPGVWSARTLAQRLIPLTIGVQQGGAVFGQLIAGKERHLIVIPFHPPSKQQMASSLRAFATQKAQNKTPPGGNP